MPSRKRWHRFTRIAALKDPARFLGYCQDLGISLPFDSAMEAGHGAPLAQPYRHGTGTIGNRLSGLQVYAVIGF